MNAKAIMKIGCRAASLRSVYRLYGVILFQARVECWPQLAEANINIDSHGSGRPRCLLTVLSISPVACVFDQVVLYQRGQSCFPEKETPKTERVICTIMHTSCVSSAQTKTSSRQHDWLPLFRFTFVIDTRRMTCRQMFHL